MTTFLLLLLVFAIMRYRLSANDGAQRALTRRPAVIEDQRRYCW